MDDRVIEAAAMAILTEFGEVPYYRDMAESAIRAADAARADAVKESRWPLDNAVAGVNLLIRLALDYMENGGEDTRDQFFKARDAIIEGLAGVPEQ